MTNGGPHLTTMTATLPVEEETQTMLSIAEVARRLNVSTATVHRLIEVRDLTHIRIGVRTIRVAESELHAYVARSTVHNFR